MKIRALTHQADLKELAPTKADWSNSLRLLLKVALEHNTKATADGQLTTDTHVRSAPAWEEVTNQQSLFVILKT